MVWSNYPLWNVNIRQICPFLDLFHIYKKMLEATWRLPQFFEPFLAPLMHQFYPSSKLKRKPNLKQIEITLAACRLVYPEIRELLVEAQTNCFCDITRVHLRNLQFFFQFLLPTVFVRSVTFYLCYNFVLLDSRLHSRCQKWQSRQDASSSLPVPYPICFLWCIRICRSSQCSTSFDRDLQLHRTSFLGFVYEFFREYLWRGYRIRQPSVGSNDETRFKKGRCGSAG